MKSVPLTAYPRTLSRRGGAKKLRDAGRIPAVIYGGKTTPQNLEVDRKSLEDLLHHSASENLLVDLTVDKDAKAKPSEKKDEEKKDGTAAQGEKKEEEKKDD